ncbi:MAG: DUF362 domain-containing protein [Clostridia bacterium]|nr:DUF362 domain-containing protein [Clostridia bacterium]
MATECVRLIGADTYQYEEIKRAVEEALDAFPLPMEGKRVAVKPNLLLARTPENASTTHPMVIRAVCEGVKNRGGKAIIAESGGGPITPITLRHLYDATGMTRAAEESGAELNFNCESVKVSLPHGKKVKEYLCLKVIREADLLINVAKLKTHGFMRMTAAVKNLFGVIPGLHKAMMHKDLPEKNDFAAMINDLCLSVKPDLSIIDGVVGMEGEGPSGGTPKKCGLLLASYNPFALDMVAAKIMGLPENEAPILRDAIRRGLIPSSADEIRVEGISLSEAINPFRFPGKRKSILGLLPGVLRYPIEDATRPYPYITKTCISCGKCAGICPQKTIFKNKELGRFQVEIKDCIRCYCCHEICPEKAIDMLKKRKYPKQ